jgi:hypothetical protein
LTTKQLKQGKERYARDRKKKNTYSFVSGGTKRLTKKTRHILTAFLFPPSFLVSHMDKGDEWVVF